MPGDVEAQSPTGSGQMSGVKLAQKPKSNTKKYIIVALVTAVLAATALGVGLYLGLRPEQSAVAASPPPPPVVEMAVVASGTVDDYTPAVQDELKTKVAEEVGVDASDVELTVTAASVRLAFRITVASEAAATAAASTLETNVASTSAASTFLTVASLTVTVESIALAPSVVLDGASPSPSPPPAVSPSNPTPPAKPPPSKPPPLSPPPSSPPPSSPPITGYTVASQISVVSATGSSRRSLLSSIGPDEATTEATFGARRRLAPTSGAYVTDPHERYVQDRTVQMMSTPNMIMCYVRTHTVPTRTPHPSLTSSVFESHSCR